MTDEEATARAAQMAYEIQHVCEPCGEVFEQARDLTRHRDIHLRPYQCLFPMARAFPTLCPERFATSRDLKRHRDALHKKRENPKKHMCTDCGGGFTRDDNLARHKNDTCKFREERE